MTADFNKCNYLFLSYPKGFLNEYEILTAFYDELIEIIPNSINLLLIVTTKKIQKELKARFSHKPNIESIVVNFWDELWLRDCMGMAAKDQIYKPYYSPNYCSLVKETKYYQYINRLTKSIFTDILNYRVTEIPLKLDGGNFVHNTQKVFITEKSIEDNPGKDVRLIIKDYTGLDAIIVNRCCYVIGHTDGYMAFKDECTLFISQYPQLAYLKKDIEYVNTLNVTAQQCGFKVLPIFDNPIDEEIECACKSKKTRSCLLSASGIYVNFIRFNNIIILPEYSLASNSLLENNWVNKKWLESLGFDVLSINCDLLAKFGGSLHCISFQC